MAQEEVTRDDARMVMKPGGALAELAESGELSVNENQLLLPFLIGAGVTTTRDVILLSITILMKHRPLLEELTADPSGVPAFIEELLRHEPPVHGLVRLAKTRAEIEGAEMPPGSKLWVILAAANRDPSKFDRPHDFVMNRTGTRHISFGNGPHFCMGSHLGRTEAEAVVELLLPEIPRLVSKADPEFFFTDIREDLPWMRSMRSWHMAYKR
jgi:cytochrome P450